MNCLLVPSLGLDLSLIERLARSVDYPILDKVVVNNGATDTFTGWLNVHRDWRMVHYGENTGCAGAWNKAPQLWPDEPAYLIINDDAWFQSGCLERLCKFVDAHALEAPVIYVNQYEAYDFFVWTKRGVEEYGTFDENFYPVYYEDWDMRCRFVAGEGSKPCFFNDGQFFPVTHGRAPAGPRYAEMMKKNAPILGNYLLRKWGVIDDKPRYKTPFDDPNLTVKDWKLDPMMRQRLFLHWAEFRFSQGTPSQYA